MVPKRPESPPRFPMHHDRRCQIKPVRKLEARQTAAAAAQKCYFAWPDWTARADRCAGDTKFEKGLHLPSKPTPVPSMLALPDSWRGQNQWPGRLSEAYQAV